MNEKEGMINLDLLNLNEKEKMLLIKMSKPVPVGIGS